jgi:hypothetical protein
MRRDRSAARSGPTDAHRACELIPGGGRNVLVAGLLCKVVINDEHLARGRANTHRKILRLDVAVIEAHTADAFKTVSRENLYWHSAKKSSEDFPRRALVKRK